MPIPSLLSSLNPEMKNEDCKHIDLTCTIAPDDKCVACVLLIDNIDKETILCGIPEFIDALSASRLSLTTGILVWSRTEPDHGSNEITEESSIACSQVGASVQTQSETNSIIKEAIMQNCNIIVTLLGKRILENRANCKDIDYLKADNATCKAEVRTLQHAISVPDQSGSTL